MRIPLSQLNAMMVAASAGINRSPVDETPAETPADAFSSHTRSVGVRIEHKPSEKQETRRERKARKVARTCGKSS